jgi:hypothetical protein
MSIVWTVPVESEGLRVSNGLLCLIRYSQDPPSAPTPLLPDKTTVVIPEISFKGTPVTEVVKVLQAQTGVPIRLQRSGNLPSVTLSAKNIQLDNAVLSVAAQTGLAMGYEKDGLFLK